MTQTGTLFVVATPIGNLKDISERAILTLQSADCIAAEDTRHSGRLLQQYGITTRVISLHEHNERERSAEILSWLQQGRDIALITDAGTPLLSDPGFYLVHEARKAGITVSPIPGACAAIAALSAAGLPSDRFVFEGFLPVKSKARHDHLTTLRTESRTIIFYEAPHRIMALMADLIEVFGSERRAVVAREITKLFETFYSDTLAGINEWLIADPQQQQGEFVVLIHGINKSSDADEEDLQHRETLKILLCELSVKQAVSLAEKITGENKNKLYKWALEEKERA